MFTGIVKGLGTLVERSECQGDARLVVESAEHGPLPAALGDSIAVSGVCLTATTIEGRRFAADVSTETLSLTTLGEIAIGAKVNLELPLCAGDPLGGHVVSGHVDGLGRLESMREDARSWRLTFSVPAHLKRFVAPKGSIAIDGISLTVNGVDDNRFDVNIIPHTKRQTSLDGIRVGNQVNIEVDLMARYLARLGGFDEET